MSKDLVASDETLSVHTRAPYWKDVPDEKWLSWRWQMSNRLNDLEELAAVSHPTLPASSIQTIRIARFASKSSPLTRRWCLSIP